MRLWTCGLAALMLAGGASTAWAATPNDRCAALAGRIFGAAQVDRANPEALGLDWSKGEDVGFGAPLAVTRPFCRVRGTIEKEIRFELNRDAFAYFSTALNQWHVEEGDFEFLIGASSRDIRLTGKVYIRNGQDFS